MTLSSVILRSREALAMKVARVFLLDARVSSIDVAISIAATVVWQRRHETDDLCMMLGRKFVFEMK